LPSEASTILNAATQASLSQTESGLAASKSPEESLQSRAHEDGKTKKKRELNVGGWISPSFSPTVSRSWLEKDQATKRFQLDSYVPQVGDTVLYYFAGHRDFLRAFPDHLAKSRISRAPLWERVEKERRKAKYASEGKGSDIIEAGDSATASSKRWWNDEWLAGEQFVNYPILCRVEKTQAEFPPDPNLVIKDSSTNTWTEASNPKAKPNKNPVLRLAVTLRPLTPVLPPSWSDAGPVDRQPLSLAPNFTVVTFPSTVAAPFLIPFAWAYIRNQLLSVDDSVSILDSKVARNGNIKSFVKLDGDYGSFRLDDMKSHFARALQLSTDNSGSGANAMHDGSRGKQVSMIPPQDAVVLRQFLSTLLDVSSNVHDADLSQCTYFFNLLRSSFPLWGGVCTVKDVYDRRTSWAHSWDMKTRGSKRNQDLAQGPLKQFLDYGLPVALDSMLRLKLECTLENFLSEENTEAEIFRYQVSEDIAPGYGCAVPVSFSFERILQRLKSHVTADDEDICYYRCFESINSDLVAIQDNCGLYNDPQSAVVQSANRVIPAVKKLLDVVVSTHIREQRDKIVAENEKKKFLASVVAPEATLDDEKDTQKAPSKSVDPFRFPFKGQLYRDWLQSPSPDVACRQDRQPRQACLPQWIPQTGDSVLYSRELHVKFVECHYDSLETNQLLVPQINPNNGGPRSDICTSGTSPEEVREAKPQMNELLSGWVTASIVNMRAEFPRTRKAPSRPDAGPEGRFATDAPILAIRLQIASDGLRECPGVVVYWRPCTFLGQDHAGGEQVTGCCPSCGIRFATSFLCPTWADQFGRRLDLEGPDFMPVSVGNPPRIRDDEADAIVRSLDLLKRRCMEQVLPDHLDPNLTTDRVKDGYLPRVVKVGNRPVPTFDLNARFGLHPEDVLSKVSREEISALLAANFLPPWLVLEDGTGSKGGAVGSLEASVSPWPKMSLELVVLRLKNDVYRHKAAITSDIIEAYVTSVCLSLAAAATRKKNPISIKKMAAVLSSRKYASSAREEAASDKGGRKGGKSKKEAKSNALSIPTAPNTSGHNETGSPMKAVKRAKAKLKTGLKSPKKKSSMKSNWQHDANGSQGKLTGERQEDGLVATKSRKTLSEEEAAIVARLEGVRRMYAAALVCVSEVTSVSYLFGTRSLKVSRQKLRQQMIAISREDVQAAQARKFLLALLESLRKDACDNRYPLENQSRPQVRVNFTVGGKPVERDTTLVIPAVSGPAPSLSSLQAPMPAATKIATVPITSVEPKCPESNATQSSGAQASWTNVMLQAGEECSVAQDSVMFQMGDYDGDLPLSRLFFGKRNRMSPCVRCQVSKKSFVFCRGKVMWLIKVLCCS
jgi:hypothetical protein